MNEEALRLKASPVTSSGWPGAYRVNPRVLIAEVILPQRGIFFRVAGCLASQFSPNLSQNKNMR